MKSDKFFEFCNILGNISLVIFGVLLILGKLKINPYLNNIAENSISFAALFFVFKFLYYENYAKKANKKIAELSDKIKQLEAKDKLINQ